MLLQQRRGIMTTKTPLLIALIALAPITARADYTYTYTNTPARVTGNGPVTAAFDSAPYQIATIGDDDDEHIASTAYVKGAYNDTIAAVNSLDVSKQKILVLSASENPVSQIVIESEDFMDTFDPVGETQLLTAAATANVIDYKLDNKRVEIYTTWDDDDEVAEVPLITASGQ